MGISFFNNAIQKKYPFEEFSSLIGNFSGGGTYQLRNDFLVDAKILHNDKVFLSKISIDSSFIVLEFTSDFSVIGSATIPKSSHVEPTVESYTISGGKGFIKVYNILGLDAVFGDIEFIEENSSILRSLVVSQESSIVRSISEKEDGQKLYNSVKFYSGYNINVSYERDTNTVVFSATKGGGLGVFCGDECPEPEECPECLKTINGISPDDTGVFSFINGNYTSIVNRPEQSSVEFGTLIPPDRIDCIRPGDPAEKGPTGPQGPPGDKGDPPSEDQIPLPGDYDDCITCDTCEVGDAPLP